MITFPILAKETRTYLIARHRGSEPGHAIALTHLGVQPLPERDMRLGGDTRALLALPIIEATLRTLNEIATFDEAGVSVRENIHAG
jgi:nicotinate-nucleotide--dimethylbenzimidazole phosphoribosyltransferase